MNEMVETMALLGQEEREKMLQLYGETMPKGTSLARRELWGFSTSDGRWMKE